MLVCLSRAFVWGWLGALSRPGWVVPVAFGVAGVDTTGMSHPWVGQYAAPNLFHMHDEVAVSPGPTRGQADWRAVHSYRGRDGALARETPQNPSLDWEARRPTPLELANRDPRPPPEGGLSRDSSYQLEAGPRSVAILQLVSEAFTRDVGETSAYQLVVQNGPGHWRSM